MAQPKSELHLPAPLDPVQAEQQGRALVTDLLGQKPAQNSTNSGRLLVREADRKQRDIPVSFLVLTGGDSWQNIYQTTGTGAGSGLTLTIIHSDARPNQYLLVGPVSPEATNAGSRKLRANQTMVPFAGSDFWIADLGLEFFHWPKQLLLKQEMRRGQSCNVIESVNPQPVPGAYSRVVSWIDIDSGGIVHADAYDARNELLKQFDPKEFKKVHGQWQLQEMEIRNRQTGSRTRVEFNLEQP
ncbi:MAG TPA: outer membrane lipoprotein-sorting protein [Bacillota bacterium]|nr:outer membrane lipoprotein-sorting protein [Bacillota bacterium]